MLIQSKMFEKLINQDTFWYLSGFGLEHTDLAENSFQTSRVFTFCGAGFHAWFLPGGDSHGLFYRLDEHTAWLKWRQKIF